MSIYKFRVLIEDESDHSIFRDIEINSTQNFEDLHQIILKAFEFDNSQMASFYVSDEDWNKGQEIALFDMEISEEKETEKVLTMSETEIKSQINIVGQHLVYTYDFLHMWNFYVELLEVLVKENKKDYPQIVYSEGQAPKQNSKDDEFNDDAFMLSENEDNSDDELFSDDIFEGFDDFENYD